MSKLTFQLISRNLVPEPIAKILDGRGNKMNKRAFLWTKKKDVDYMKSRRWRRWHTEAVIEGGRFFVIHG
jgi:hypothetical protein